jgi:tRNA-splicing ligase RtcB
VSSEFDIFLSICLIENYLKNIGHFYLMEPKKLSDNIWELPKEGNMKVPAIIYASKKLMDTIKQDKTLEQARNVACLKGIQRASLVMPDAHQGYLAS